MSDRFGLFNDILSGSSEVPFATSAWQHFVGEEYDPHRFASATVDFVRTWDWDWVKINPRAVYYAEAWGSVFDPDDYAGMIPKQLTPAIADPADLATIQQLVIADTPSLAEHVTSSRLIREELPDRPLLQTVFSPLSVLLQIAGLPLYPGDVVYGADTSFTQDDLLRSDPDATHAALRAIAATLADYVTELLKPVADGGAGLNGIFYAVTGTASDGHFDADSFETFSRPYDQLVLDAVTNSAADAAVVFHTCKANSHPEWFVDYPIDALHWDQFLPGNPPVDEDLGITPVGGVRSDLFAPGSDPQQVADQLRRTLAARENQPFLLAPSCTIPTPADPELLRALRNAR